MWITTYNAYYNIGIIYDVFGFKEKVLLVKFPYSGSEHKCKSTNQVKEWNTGDHARKFIRAKGK